MTANQSRGGYGACESQVDVRAYGQHDDSDLNDHALRGRRHRDDDCDREERWCANAKCPSICSIFGPHYGPADS